MPDKPNQGFDPIFICLKYLFGEYVEEKEYTTEQSEQVGIREFWEWLSTHMALFDDEQLSKDANVPHGTVDYIHQLCSDPFMAMNMKQFWTMMTLGSRKPPKLNVNMIRLSVGIGYEDGVMAVANMPTVPDEKTFTDATATMILRKQFQELFGMLCAKGLDGWKEQFGQPTQAQFAPPTASQPPQGMTGPPGYVPPKS